VCVRVCVYVCVCTHASASRTAWCSFFAHTTPMDVSHTPSPVFLTPRNVCGGSVLSVMAPVLAMDAFCLFASALASRGPLIWPHRHLPFALGHVFDSQEHTHKASVMRHSSCVCASMASSIYSTHSTVLRTACTDAMDA